MVGEFGYAGIIIFAAAAVVFLHAWFLRVRGRWTALDPLNFFWVGALMVYFMGSFSQARVLIQRYGEDLFCLTWIWILTGFVLVICGYESRLGVRLGNKVPQFAPRMNPTRMRMAGLLLVTLGIIGYAYTFAVGGGLAKWASVARGGQLSDQALTPIIAMGGLLPLGVAVLLFHVNMHRTTTFVRATAWSLTGLLLLWNVYLGSRSHTIALSVTMLSAYYLPRRKSPPVVVLGLLFFLLYGVTNFQGHYRDKFRDFSFHFDKINTDEARSAMFPELFRDEEDQQDDFAPGGELNAVMTTVKYVPDEVSYTYGYGYLQIFTTLVPRKFWHDKVYPSVEAHQGVLRRLGGKSPTMVRGRDLIMGPAFTFVGHWYYIGGPFILVLASLYTGVLFRFLRTLYDRSPGSESDVVIYAKYCLIGFSEAAATPSGWLYDYYTPVGLLVLFWIAREKSP